MDTSGKNFGPRLRAYIETNCPSADSAATDLGVARATLYNWFAQDTPPTRRSQLAKLRAFLGKDADHILGAPSKSDQLEEAAAPILDTPLKAPQVSYSSPPPREPTMQELMDLSLNIIGKARRVPGGLYQLQRALKRFEKDHIDPIE